MKLFFHWALSAIVIFIAAQYIPSVEVTYMGAILAAVFLALLSLFIKPLLLLITLPLNIITLGLFSLVINALLVYVAGMVVPGFTVTDFWWALVFGIVLSLINILFGIKSNWGSR